MVMGEECCEGNFKAVKKRREMWEIQLYDTGCHHQPFMTTTSDKSDMANLVIH